MRHRYRIALIALLLAGCGVQDLPATPTASPPAAGQPAASPAPATPLNATAAPASPERGATPPVSLEPYPPPALAGYPPPEVAGPPPAVPSTPATSLPLDRIWLLGEHMLAIAADGSALRFELPPESPLGGGHRHFYGLVRRPNMPPAIIVQGAAEGTWHLIDPVTGAGIDLPITGTVPPNGIAGAKPGQFLLTDGNFDTPADKKQMALVDLAAGTATALEVPEPRIAMGNVVAWRDSAAYVYARERADGSGAWLLWRVDLAASPPAAVEQMRLIGSRLEADQTRGLLLVDKIGSDNATLIDVVSGAEEELPIPVGIFSPNGALIAALRPMDGDRDKAELVVYDRAARTVRVLASDLVIGRDHLQSWYRSEAALLLTATELLPGGETRKEIATQVWLDGRPARQLTAEDMFGVTFTPLDNDHLLVMRYEELSAPAFGGGPPAFAPLPLANAGEIVYVP